MEGKSGDGRMPLFVARLLDGEATTDMCRAFGISRKTGYKVSDRYKAYGLAALSGSRCLGTENLAAPRQPVRPEVVTHVLGTFCHPCLRAGHRETGAGEGIRTLDPDLGKVVLYH